MATGKALGLEALAAIAEHPDRYRQTWWYDLLGYGFREGSFQPLAVNGVLPEGFTGCFATWVAARVVPDGALIDAWGLVKLPDGSTRHVADIAGEALGLTGSTWHPLFSAGVSLDEIATRLDLLTA